MDFGPLPEKIHSKNAIKKKYCKVKENYAVIKYNC